MKTIYDYKHVKGVSAVALLKDGQRAGKIVANWSDNPAGTVCTAAVILSIDGGEQVSGIGKAGGYGYDKLSSAIYEALKRCKRSRFIDNEIIDTPFPMHEHIKVHPGSGDQRQAFEEAGYTYIEII